MQSENSLLYFVPLFSTSQVKIWYGVKTVQVDNSDTIFFLVRLNKTRETTAVFFTVSRNALACIHTFFNQFDSCMIWWEILTYSTFWWYWFTPHFDTSLICLACDSRSQEREKANTSMPVIAQSCQSIYVEFGILLRLVSVMNLVSILCRPFDIKGRQRHLRDIVKKKKEIKEIEGWGEGGRLYSDIYRLISFELGWW